MLSRGRWLRPGAIIRRRSGLALQPVGTGLVPAVDLHVCLSGEDIGRQVAWKVLARLRMLQTPVFDRILHERDVLLGAEQYLERLPPREASKGQGGDRGRLKVVVGGLERVLAAGDLPDVGDGRVRHIDEEGYMHKEELAHGELGGRVARFRIQS